MGPKKDGPSIERLAKADVAGIRGAYSADFPDTR